LTSSLYGEKNQPSNLRTLKKLAVLYKSENLEETLTALSKLKSIPKALQAPFTIMKVEALLTLGNTVRATKILEQFVDTNKISQCGQLEACQILANIYYKNKKFKKTSKLISTILKKYPHHRDRYELKQTLARSQEKSGFKKQALLTYLGLGESKLQKAPARNAFKHLLKLFVNHKFPSSTSLETKLRWGALLLRKREYTRVLDVVTPLINSLSSTTYSKSEEYSIYLLGGQVELARRNGWWACHLFKKAAKSAPDDNKKAKATLLAGDSMYRLSHYERAQKLYQTVCNKYSKSLFAAKATYGLANIQKKIKNVKKVNSYYDEIIQKWPGSWFAEKVSWEMGISQYNQRNYKKAAESFKSFIKVAPADRLIPAARYWLAKSLSHLKKYKETRIALKDLLRWPSPGLYHLSAAYYNEKKSNHSLLLGLPMRDFDKRKHHIESLRNLVPRRPKTKWAHIDTNISSIEKERIKLLKELKLTKLLVNELQRLVFVNKGNKIILRNNLAWAYNENLDYPGCIEQGEIMLQSPDVFASIDRGKLFDKLYPLPSDLPFDKHCDEFNVPPFLTYSVTREESHFDRGLISWAGAKGLMQVMNPTGRWIAPKIGIKKFTPEMLYRPSVNIKAGCWYLDYLTKMFSKYPNSTILAIASYNGGPGNMNKWLKKQGNKKKFCLAEFIEKWPLSETRNYVRKVGRSIICYELLN